MTSRTAAIAVENVRKNFHIPLEGSQGLKQKLVTAFKKGKGYKTFTPLKDVSFEVQEGDFFGIVGRNGSGKSTLLKILAGIYVPDSGSVKINGTLVPFIELGVGFNAELTGRENVFLNGALLGFSRKEMNEMYDEIVEFAELGEFMDERLKNYSSGMQVRLAFSIAIRAKSDILLLDEVLAVGDEAFQRKCFEYFAELKKEKRTVVLVTHDMTSVQRFCNRAMLINDGEIVEIGNPASVAQKYQKLNQPKSTTKEEKARQQKKDTRLNTALLEASERNVLGPETEKLTFRSVLTMDQDLSDTFFGLTIRRQSGELLYWFTTEAPNKALGPVKNGESVTIDLSVDNIFGDGTYLVSTTVKSNDRSIEYIVNNDIVKFTIAGRGANGWALHPRREVEIRK